MAVAMLTHMQRFYDLLDSLAETDEEGGKVYTGHITNDFNTLELPIPYYSRMTRIMQQMGCMTQLQRGGRASPSKWVLTFRPTEESYSQVDPREGNMNSLNEQIRVYQSSQDQKMRVIRRELSQAQNRIAHLTTAITHQASLISHIYSLLQENMPIPAEELNVTSTPETTNNPVVSSNTEQGE